MTEYRISSTVYPAIALFFFLLAAVGGLALVFRAMIAGFFSELKRRLINRLF